jgi:hypothetical protein
MEDRLHSYMYAAHFSNSVDSGMMKDLLFDSDTNKSVATQLREYAKKYPKSILLNKILVTKAYKNSKGVYKKPSEVYATNSKHLPPDAKKLARQEWEDFLNSSDSAERRFFNRLAKYAYLTSGFRNGLKTFYDLIPTMWNIENGMGNTINNLNLEMTDVSHAGIDQVIRHEYMNPKYAPRLYSSSKGVVPMEKSLGLLGGVKLLGYLAERHLSTGFITVEIGGVVKLYKNGGYEVAEKNGETYTNPIFYPISPLGYTSAGGFRVVEYRYGETKVDSIFDQNKVTVDPKIMDRVSQAYELDNSKSTAKEEYTQPECKG